MTSLQCSANSCASNSGGFCCRPSIKVKGLSAYSSSETSCSSYTEKSGGFSNGTQYNSPNQSLDIKCNVRNCTHNSSDNCSANSICVNSGFGGAECSSFKSK